MRQVPAQNDNVFLLVGSGRLSSHLQFYFRKLGFNFLTWSRPKNGERGIEISELLPLATHVLLAISDSAIPGFYDEKIAPFIKTSGDAKSEGPLKVIHFSGAFHDSRMISAHPLMSFSHDLFTLSTYQQIHFCLTGVNSMEEALPGLPNSFSLLPAKKKALYHAVNVMAGNFSTILWQTAWQELEKMNLPLDAFDIYLQQNLRNFYRSPETALTGPLARKDQMTIEQNIQALPAELRPLYLEFVRLKAPEIFANINKEAHT